MLHIAVIADSERKESTECQRVFLYGIFSTKDVIQLYLLI